jgi:ribosomal protein L12E/L44/L45/RPP1/RPP2
LAGIEKNMVEGGKKAATVFSESFRLETSKALTTASGSISQAFGTVLKPKMTAAGLEAGKSYSSGLGTGIKASQAEVTGSLAGINAAFAAHRQVIADTTTKVEGFGLAAVAMGGKVTAAVHPLGTLGTGFKGLGGAAKEAGEHLKGLGASVLGVGESIAKGIASPLGLAVALGSGAAAAGLLTEKLIKLGDQWSEVDRTLMVSGAATSETIAGLDHIVQDVASHSSSAISGISGVVATLSAQTHGLSGAEMRDLTTDIADLGEMLGHPIDTRSLLEGAHALGVADDGLKNYLKSMFSVSRATGVPMEQIIEEAHKTGFAPAAAAKKAPAKAATPAKTAKAAKATPPRDLTKVTAKEQSELRRFVLNMVWKTPVSKLRQEAGIPAEVPEQVVLDAIDVFAKYIHPASYKDGTRRS